MALSNPIEVVVIRDLALRPCPEPAPAEPAGAPSELPPPDSAGAGGYTESHERESIALMQTIVCDVRQAVLLALARDGPAFVGQLARRVNSSRPWAEKVDQKLLSHHLTHLRRAGLVHERRRGRQHWYDIDATNVLYQQHAGEGMGGGFSLKIRARGLPVAVTISVGGSVGNS